MRYPSNQQPAAEQAVDAQGIKPEVFVGHRHQNIFPDEVRPLPDWRTLSQHNLQAENHRMVLNAMHGRMAERMRPRVQDDGNDALRKELLVGPPAFQAQRAEVDAEMVLPNFVHAFARNPPGRNENPAGVADKAAVEKAGDRAQENGAERRRQLNAERRRQLNEREDRMFFHLEDYGAERRRLVDERIARLRASAQKRDEEPRRQIRARRRDEELREMNEQLDRLSAELSAEVMNDNPVEPAGGANDAGEARRARYEFGRVFADNVAAAPVGGNREGEIRQPRRRMPFGRRQEGPPATALRPQRILDRAERRIQRSQQILGLKREEENDDEAAPARRFEIPRRSNAAMHAAQEPEVLSAADEADDEGDFEHQIWI